MRSLSSRSLLILSALLFLALLTWRDMLRVAEGYTQPTQTLTAQPYELVTASSTSTRRPAQVAGPTVTYTPAASSTYSSIIITLDPSVTVNPPYPPPPTQEPPYP